MLTHDIAPTRRDLIATALKLGAAGVRGWSRREEVLVNQSGAAARAVDRGTIERLRERIRAGDDPLGRAFIESRAPCVRRGVGATYTPGEIVHAMLESARQQGNPQRIVDPGAGSGRFLLRAAHLFPAATLIGVEIDPLAALIARANLAALGVARRSHVVTGDYRRADLRTGERSLFIGNPPYVRHHLISAHWKDWLVRHSREQGVEASRLAGLHVHFFIATVLNARPGDYGAFVTAAEWLDVNYGAVLRKIFLGRLGGQTLVLIRPTALPFPDAATTAAITAFRIGSRVASVRVRRVSRPAELKDLSGGRLVSRNRLETEARWSRLTRAARPRLQGFVELGELCQVHRGQATGANAVWIAGEAARDLPPTVLFPTVTRARELIAAGKVLGTLGDLRSVIDLPADLDLLERPAREAVARFLRDARRLGTHRGYLARHRRAWWAVGLGAPAAILATYMARRPPAFSRNPLGARHINIAHGLYPREELSDAQLSALVEHLSGSVSVIDGRTYAGGLTKFEPREMERLPVPGLQLLTAGGLQGRAGPQAASRAPAVTL